MPFSTPFPDWKSAVPSLVPTVPGRKGFFLFFLFQPLPVGSFGCSNPHQALFMPPLWDIFILSSDFAVICSLMFTVLWLESRWNILFLFHFFQLNSSCQWKKKKRKTKPRIRLHSNTSFLSLTKIELFCRIMNYSHLLCNPAGVKGVTLGTDLAHSMENRTQRAGWPVLQQECKYKW